MAKRQSKSRRSTKLALANFRVYRVPRSLKTEVASARQAAQATVEAFVNDAVANQLSGVVTDVHAALGPKATGDVSPVRLPMHEKTLEALSAAASHTGLAGSQLLLACLSRAAARKPKSERRKRGG